MVRAILLLPILLMMACGPQGTPVGTGIRVGLEGSIAALDPRLAVEARAMQIDPLIYSSLLQMDQKGRLVPDLACSWSQPDARTYLFRLRRGVRFHDGREVTADDVRATFTAIMEPSHRSPRRGSFAAVKAIEVVDRYTVRFVLQDVYCSFPYALTVGICPEGSPWGQKDPPIGSGPFILQRWRPGEELVLVANPNYFGGRPRLDWIQFRILANTTTRLLEMEKGAVDLLQNCVPAYAVKFMQRVPGLQVIQEQGITYQYLGYNLLDPILRHKEVRQAISHAIDCEAIIAYTLKGLAMRADGVVLSPYNWAYEGNIHRYAYDPEQAKALLDAAGFPDPDGDGPRMRFNLSYKTSTDMEAIEIAQIIKGYLKRVGIGLEVRSFEWGTFFDDIMKGNFQVYSLRWVGVVDPDIFYYLFHSSSFPPNGANRGRYSNADLDSILEQSRRTCDQKQRKALYSRIQKILAEDAVYTSLWYRDNLVVIRKGFSGFQIYAGGEYRSLQDVFWEGNHGASAARP
ncbi:MAG: ABC transporter substrate-binding protein [Desulfobacterales bacterium]|nr:ABC transporter substrate-binding protein [Desulfobacterales bacterium]